jgi:predicted RNA-binding protein YlxR (DUF448 family)
VRTPAQAGVQGAAPQLGAASAGRGAAPGRAKADKDGPERKCVLTGGKTDRAALIRLVLAPDGQVLPDVRAKAPGRGAWIGVGRDELQRALDSGKLKSALFRGFRRRDLTVPADLPEQIERQLERAALDRLGLEARASTLVTGSDRIENAARSGKLLLLLHAADAGEDGNRKLDQAWRVGEGEEGGDRRGLVIAASRTILSAALGRENVVHVGVTDAGAARRLGEVLARWHRFIGFGSGERPCETLPQGPIAAAAPEGDAAEAANEGLTTVHE